MKKMMKSDALNRYALERNALQQQEVETLVKNGKALLEKSDLVEALSRGGSAFFPHTYIGQCGDQIAAVAEGCIQACRRTGKKQILALGALHALLPPLIESRKKEVAGIDILDDPCRGIFSPEDPLTAREFSLDHFAFFLEKAGQKEIRLICRYPNLIYGNPSSAKGIQELQRLAEESIVVATADLCHHGVAYGHTQPNGIDFAHATILKNLRLLEKDDLRIYREYALESLSDSVEVGQILRFLLGPLRGHICDLRLVDVAGLFEGNPSPSWVAAAFVVLEKDEVK